MADVKWIKIVTDIFDDEKIKLIEAMPEADSIIVIWFKLLCMAGKQNNGGVFMLNDKIAYTDEMLSTIFRRPLNTVRLALSTFERFGMVEIINDTITIPSWGKYQNLEGIETAREKTRQRVAAYRERQKQLAECNVTGRNSNVTVTHTDIDQDIDKEKDIDIYNKGDKSPRTQKAEQEAEQKAETYKHIVGYLNTKAGTKYKASCNDTKKKINARLSEGFTIADFETVIDKKCAEWRGTEWEKFLRPLTLFGPKFESYLNAKISNGKGNSYADNRERAEQTAEAKWGRIGTHL